MTTSQAHSSSSGPSSAPRRRGPRPPGTRSWERVLHERLEEVAPLLVRGEVLLRPRAELAEAPREMGVLDPVALGDLAPDPLRERRRGAARRDRDRDRIGAVDRREDEVADLERVGDVAEEQPFLGLRVDAAVQLRVGGRRDDEEALVEVAALEAALEELDR